MTAKRQGEGDSRRVFDTLETLISPGQRSRLSPYVEAAQYRVLFGEDVSGGQRVERSREIMRAHQGRIADLVRLYVEFAQEPSDYRDRFSEQRYSERDFLDMYLAYYFTANVPKFQLVLLEMARRGLLGESVKVVDVGVGPATAGIAVLDFLFAWSTAAALHRAKLPWQTVSLCGVDRSDGVISIAREVVAAYGEELRRRVETAGEKTSETHAEREWTHTLESLTAAAEGASWRRADVGVIVPEEIADADLVILGNTITEWGDEDHVVARLDVLVDAMHPGACLLVMEPGARAQAERLMRVRYKLGTRSRLLVPVLPCGDDSDLTAACGTCWNARFENLHETELYKEFRSRTAELWPGAKERDNFENRLLSWSYWVGQVTAMPPPHPERRAKSSDHSEDCADRITDLVYLGTRERGQVIEVCPAAVPGARQVRIESPDWLVVPRFRFAESFDITGVTIEGEGSGSVTLVPQDGDATRFRRNGGYGSSHGPPLAHTPPAWALDEIAYRLFGFPSLKPFQHEVIGRALVGDSVFAIAATGSGKSECFILAAMLGTGATIVVCPLRSLIADQYYQRIKKRYGLDGLATFLNGELDFHEKDRRLRRAELGFYKLIYTTPEQLQRDHVLSSIQRTAQEGGLDYLALDEAHCISQWGHDFRPAYLNILRRLRERDLDPTRIALTATASPFVRQDVCEELDLTNAPFEAAGDVLLAPADRSELNLVVRATASKGRRTEQVIEELESFLSATEGEDAGAIVFMPWAGDDAKWASPDPHSPRTTQLAADLETRFQTRVSVYYGSMDADREEGEEEAERPLGDIRGRVRREEQDAFIDGRRKIMVATKGFGMGIDKPDVRLIVHRSPPGNLESYAQEAGRAGRDGKVATVVLHYCSEGRDEMGADYRIQADWIADRYVRREDVAVMNAFLHSVNARTDGRLVFSSIEAQAFFNRCITSPSVAGLSSPYEWPPMRDRNVRGFESPEHTEVLDRGHRFQHETSHVQRILDVLYRIRPRDEASKTELVYVDSLSSIRPIILKRRILKAADIMRSPAYFGAELRKAGVSAAELTDLLEPGRDLGDLAQRLGLSVTSTSLLIDDIQTVGRSFGGRRGHALLDLWLTVRKTTPHGAAEDVREWIDFAGATKRLSKPKAEEAAHRAGRPKPGWDDWFDWSTTPSPVAWELKPGPAFRRDQAFADFLSGFMRLHDRRRQNDEASFAQLLTDYLGVGESGEVVEWTGPSRCLKAALLGYLQTNEVVQVDAEGGCLSCNYCVKDEDFTATPTQRSERVFQIKSEIAQALERVQEASAAAPSQEDIASLRAHIKTEEAAGRTAATYVQFWIDRLVDDQPDHVGVRWLTIEAAIDGPLEIGAARAARFIEDLRASSDADDNERLWAAVASAHEKFPEAADVSAAQARLCSALDYPHLEIEAWQRVCASALIDPSADWGESGSLVEEGLKRLVELTAPGADNPQVETHVASARALAARGATPLEVRDTYRQYLDGMTFSERCNEIDLADPTSAYNWYAGAVLFALESTGADDVPDSLAAGMLVVAQREDHDVVVEALRLMSPAVRASAPGVTLLLIWYVAGARDLPLKPKAVAAIFFDQERGFDSLVLKAVLSYASTSAETRQAIRERLSDPPARRPLLARIADASRDLPGLWKAGLRDFFDADDLVAVTTSDCSWLLSAYLNAPDTALGQSDQGHTPMDAQSRLFCLLLEHPPSSSAANKVWLDHLATTDGGLEPLVEHCIDCLTRPDPLPAFAEATFQRILEVGGGVELARALEQLKTVTAKESPLMAASVHFGVHVRPWIWANHSRLQGRQQFTRETMSDLRGRLTHQMNEASQGMLVTALEEVRGMVRGEDSLRTVAKALIEAACSAGVWELATETARTNSRVVFPGDLGAEQYIQRQRAEAGDVVVPADLTFAASYRRVWRALCR